MQNIRSVNTKMELSVRSALHKKGYRFRKNVKRLIGKPDIVFSKYKVAIFLDSCFWHCCPYHSNIPSTNKSYWIPKLQRNKERAKEVNKKLRMNDWIVLRFWEHQVNKNIKAVIDKIESYLTI